MCQIIPLIMGDFGEIGAYIRLDVFRDQETKTSKPSNRKRDAVKQPYFQFGFDIYTGKFIREMRDPSKQKKTPFGKNP